METPQNERKLSWENALKPWGTSPCRDFYIFSEEQPSLQTVAESSGRSLRTLKSWSGQEGWVVLRRNYQQQLFEQIQKNILLLEGDRLAEEFLQLNRKHRQGFALIKELSVRYLAALAWQDVKAIKSFDAIAFQRVASVFAQAVEGERKSYNADSIQDQNRAFQLILRQGYEIHEPIENGKTWTMKDLEPD